MNEMSAICRLLGSFFYLSINAEQNQIAIGQLRQHYHDINEEFSQFVLSIDSDDPQALDCDFFKLFEGAAVMDAPPWGSVYLDQESILFGYSTVRYQHFMHKYHLALNLDMNEPRDQFGLMLLAASELFERKDSDIAVKELFGEHILPWCFRYLELVELHADTNSYKALARLACACCAYIKEDLDINIESVPLYR
ncbi:molecular chaperone [Vibrio sinensis]|uniref:Molecular chaperone n=1 Tax=Vibrio sinensis TaxID=2302434 RepID=A0A3A6R996_9VIBR|nr:molecular chaperone [Vibrio sinensis]RJX73662.1 molecular chaperone [Vibrio sinensis]